MQRCLSDDALCVDPVPVRMCMCRMCTDVFIYIMMAGMFSETMPKIRSVCTHVRMCVHRCARARANICVKCFQIFSFGRIKRDESKSSKISS